jgi:hypothetical protein
MRRNDAQALRALLGRLSGGGLNLGGLLGVDHLGQISVLGTLGEVRTLALSTEL